MLHNRKLMLNEFLMNSYLLYVSNCAVTVDNLTLVMQGWGWVYIYKAKFLGLN